MTTTGRTLTISILSLSIGTGATLVHYLLNRRHHHEYDSLNDETYVNKTLVAVSTGLSFAALLFYSITLVSAILAERRNITNAAAEQAEDSPIEKKPPVRSYKKSTLANLIISFMVVLGGLTLLSLGNTQSYDWHKCALNVTATKDLVRTIYGNLTAGNPSMPPFNESHAQVMMNDAIMRSFIDKERRIQEVDKLEWQLASLNGSWVEWFDDWEFGRD